MAAPAFSYDVGYSGVVKLAGQQVLATGGNMSIQYTPLYTSGVWGAGWYNATEKIAYAPNYVTLSSSISYQLTSPLTATLSNWAFKTRNKAETYAILPNGKAGYSGSAYCIGCSFSASQDAIVSGDFSLKTGDINGSITSGSSGSLASTDSIGSGNLSSCCSNYIDVFPFWASAVYFKAVDSAARESISSITDNLVEALDWNASYSSDLVFVMTCCGTSDSLVTSDSTGVIQAKYCCLGAMDATGSVTIFGVSEHMKASTIRHAKNCSITMKNAGGTESCGINFSKILVDSGSIDLQTGTSLIQTTFNFGALGNGTQPPMLFSVPSGGNNN